MTWLIETVRDATVDAADVFRLNQGWLDMEVGKLIQMAASTRHPEATSGSRPAEVGPS